MPAQPAIGELEGVSLVQAQQRTVSLRQLAHPREEARFRQDDVAVAQGGFGQNEGNVLARQGHLERLQRVERDDARVERRIARQTQQGLLHAVFFLIDQGEKLAAYVISSKSETYSQGERIGTFEKSSLPNVYRAEWKDMDEDIEQTTAYFDDKGNLKIDVKRKGRIEVLSFEKK